MLSSFYEDNAGQIFCFVFNNQGDAINLIRIPDETPFEELLMACKYGWPDADTYDPDNFGGKSIEEVQNEFELSNGDCLIAEAINDQEPMLYPCRMGIAGKKLFQVGETS